MTERKDSVYRFSDVEVHEGDFRLKRAGETLSVEPKAFRLLIHLLRNSGRLISKEELLKAVWGDTAVTENSLTRSIALLRRLLDDDTRTPRYIETVATAGYRFICQVVEEQSPNEAKPGNILTRPVVRARKISISKLSAWLITSIVVLGTLAAVISYLRRPLSAPRITEFVQLTRDGQRKILGGTDGTRLYFDQWDSKSIGEVPIVGGEVVKSPIALKATLVSDVSPDGSSLLVEPLDGGLWSIGVLGDSLRHLADGVEGVWSPDGKSVAYTDSAGDIYVIQSDGSNLHRINATIGAGPSRLTFYLSWSPDGTRIRFTRNHELWEISASGSDPRKLIPDWRPPVWKCCGRWTPDGAFFVFLSASTVEVPAGGPTEIWAIDERRKGMQTHSTEPVLLATGPMRWGSPIPARDGKTIFARGIVQRGELVRFDAQSREMRPYLGGISAEYVAFSRDGKSIAYTSYPDGTLWKSNVDGSGRIELTQPPIYPKLLRWSPDGAQILFNDLASDGQLIAYVVSAQGGQPRRLLPDYDDPQMDPNWSPDGMKVIFSTAGPLAGRLNATFSSKVELRVLDLATHTVSVVPESRQIWSPRWSPNGEFIVGLADIKRDLEVFEVQHQRWRKLVDGPVYFPAWSRDSQFIYFLDSSGNVSRVSLDGRRAELVADLKGFSHTGWMGDWMGLDPSDAPLLLHDVGTEDLYALTLERK